VFALVLLVAMTIQRRRARPTAIAVAEPAEPAAVISPSGSVHLVLAHGTGRLGRYQILNLLGRGGTASVYLANTVGEAGFERRVAIKIMQPELFRNAQTREMFLDEARLASRIDHPNVVAIYDLGRTDDGYYIAMEHVDGSDLETLLHYTVNGARRVPIDIALAIVRRICDGLHAAHTAVGANGEPMGLIHRDVKLGNVLVSRNGAVKVGDFGIAKARAQHHITALGETRGTLGLMAPEQRLGRELDARADIFGVGAIAYQLVTGFSVDLDINLVVQRGVVGWPHLRRVRDVRPDAPVELDAILWRALAYDAESRQTSCAELEAELAVVMEAHGWTTTDREIGEWLSRELARWVQFHPATYMAATPSHPTPT
jgi:serine/threonine-protein kinase